MSSSNNRLDQPIVTHRRTRSLWHKAPRKGTRIVVFRPIGSRPKAWEVATRKAA